MGCGGLGEALEGRGGAGRGGAGRARAPPAGGEPLALIPAICLNGPWLLVRAYFVVSQFGGG